MEYRIKIILKARSGMRLYKREESMKRVLKKKMNQVLTFYPKESITALQDTLISQVNVYQVWKMMTNFK